MGWMKKNLSKIVYVLFLVVAFYLTFVTVKSKFGTVIHEEIISNFPFLEFGDKLYKKVCEISGEAPSTIIPKKSTFIFDILKLLIATPAIMLVRRFIYNKIPFVSDFLKRVPTAKFEANIQKEANATGAISISPALKERLMAQEKDNYYESSIEYKLKTGIVNVLIAVGTLFLTVFFLDKQEESILNFLSTTTGSLIGIVSILIFFLVYCLIFQKIEHCTFSFSIVKTIVFNIIPNVLSTLITSVLVYCYHMFVMVNKDLVISLIFGFFILVLCDFEAKLEKKFQVWTVANKENFNIINKGNFNFRFSTFISALCIYSSYIIAAQLYTTDIDILMQNSFFQMFCNIKALPFYEYIISGTKVIDKMNLTDTAFMAEILKMCFFAFSVCIISKFIDKIKTDFSIQGYIKWSVKLSIKVGFVFAIYSFILYVTKCDMRLMSLSLIVYAIVTFVINLLPRKSNSIFSFIGLGLTNIMFEVFLIIVGEMILIYVAEIVAHENFLYLSISYSASSTIDDILTEGFIIRMLIISVATIIWYVCEAFDLGVKNKD